MTIHKREEMKFTTLDVKRGDSFLLETDSKKILVDTGDNKDECRDFLLAKNLQELDLVIITHYDADHVNGLLNLIKSKIKIDEIWLPDSFGRIHETLKEEKDNLLNLTFAPKYSINSIQSPLNCYRRQRLPYGT